MRNSIVAGSLNGGSCDYYITSEGGNVDGGGTQSTLSSGGAMLPPETAGFLLVSAQTSSPVGDARRQIKGGGLRINQLHRDRREDAADAGPADAGRRHQAFARPQAARATQAGVTQARFRPVQRAARRDVQNPRMLCVRGMVENAGWPMRSRCPCGNHVKTK